MKGRTQLSAYNNSWYRPGGSSVKRLLWYFANLLVVRNRYLPISALKVATLRAFGAKIGRGVVIKPGVNIKYPWRLHVGDYSWIGEDVWIDNLDQVSIGANCCLSQGALLLCGNHNYSTPGFDLITGPITLDDGVWIGARALVGPHTHCLSHSVLAVNSSATGQLDAYSVYRGNPAQKIRERKLTTTIPN